MHLPSYIVQWRRKIFQRGGAARAKFFRDHTGYPNISRRIQNLNSELSGIVGSPTIIAGANFAGVFSLFSQVKCTDRIGY